MILKVARLGHPVLRKVARDLAADEIRSPEIRRFVDDMIDTMREYNGVGLAAPQVHEGVRILVLEVRKNPRYPQAPEIPLTVFFNLHIQGVGDDMVTDWEGCLSVPGMRGLVPRFRRVQGTALDSEANPITVDADGFLARILQHEGDHLDGRVYLDRMESMQSLSFLEEFQRYVVGSPGAAE